MSDATPLPPGKAVTAPPNGRFEAIDALRGVALAGMVIFHTTWDLGHFGFIAPEIPFSPPFMTYGHIVASMFLALVGASLVLASREAMNWPAFWRRFLKIALAAALITGVTWFVFPQNFIFFGILHCIAVASLVAVVFVRKPVWMALLLGAVMLATPVFYASPVFDEPPLWWVGLGLQEPPSNDWRPIFPWVGFSLIGVAVMRVALARGWTHGIAQWRAKVCAARALVWAGRRSLLIYLVHQPVLFTVVWAASPLVAPSQEAAYQRSCEAQCSKAGGEAAFCTRACGCVAVQLKQQDMWGSVLGGDLSSEQKSRFVALSQICARDAQQ